MLQTARQAKGEDPQSFADRCRQLAGKIICKVEHPVAQPAEHGPGSENNSVCTRGREARTNK